MKKKKVRTEKYLLSISNSLVRFFLDIMFYIVVVIAVVVCSRYAYTFCYQVFGSDAVSTTEDAKEIEFYIQSGDSTKEVAKKLEREGIIKNNLSFYVKAKLNKYNILPGTYVLTSAMDYNTILSIIASTSEGNGTEGSEE